MKKVAWLVLIVAFLLAFVVTDVRSGPIVLKGVTAFPKNNLNNDPVPIFVDKVNKRAKGRLRIDWLGGPEVTKAFDQIHALKAGTIEMLLYYPFPYMKPLMPEAEARGLRELAAWEERKSGAFDLWSKIFVERVNAKYLGSFHNVVGYHIYSNKKIESIDDFKGMKIRAQPLYIPLLKSLGAVPVTMRPPEIYTAMERGVVDAFMWVKIGMISWGLHEVTKYVIEPTVFQMCPATMINLDKWNKIPKELQEIIMNVMKDMEYIATMRLIMIAEKEDSVRKQAGMEYLQLPPADAERFRTLAYEKTWELVLKNSPENGPKLRELSSKKALPKGTFSWQ
jgi:TRAP-type C4-dicarboxylate transport system substrate-binding protein